MADGHESRQIISPALTPLERIFRKIVGRKMTLSEMQAFRVRPVRKTPRKAADARG